MSRKIKPHFTQIISLLNDLHKSFPTYNVGRHLSTALEGYGDVWGMTDKELLYALNKYKTELDLDMPHSLDVDIQDIIQQGMNLDNILDEEEEY
jgi:hypothetical protein